MVCGVEYVFERAHLLGESEACVRYNELIIEEYFSLLLYAMSRLIQKPSYLKRHERNKLRVPRRQKAIGSNSLIMESTKEQV